MNKNKGDLTKINYTNLKLKIYVSKKELVNFKPQNLQISDSDIKVLFTKDDKDPMNVFTFELSNVKENFKYKNLYLNSEEFLKQVNLSDFLVTKNKEGDVILNMDSKNTKASFKKDVTRVLELSGISNESEKIIKEIKKDIDLAKSDQYKISDEIFIFPDEYLNMFLEKIDKENDDFKKMFNKIYEDRNKMISKTLSEIDTHTNKTKSYIKEQIEISKDKKDQFAKEKLKQINIFLEKIDKENDDFKKMFNKIYEARNKIIDKTISEADSHINKTKSNIKDQVEISKDKFTNEKLKQKEEIEAKIKEIEKETEVFKERLDKYVDIVKEEGEKRKIYTKLLVDKEIEDIKEELKKTKKEVEKQIKDTIEKASDMPEETSSEIINKKENLDFKNKYQKLLESTTKEKEEILKYKSVDFIKEILPGLDMLDSAINSDGISDEAKKWFVGFEMIVADFKKTLKMAGVEEILVKKGDMFNPEQHLAIEEVITDEVDPGAIIKVNLTGYLIKDRLLRPATVTIAKRRGKK